MPSFRINFTKITLQNISSPVKSEAKKGGVYDIYYDEKEKGLTLLVSNGGAKTFYLYTKVHGKPERIKLGGFPEISIEQARKLARHNKGLITSDINPNQEKHKLRQEITFKELFEQYMERYSKREKRSWKYDEREVNKFLSHWFKRKISSISKQEIQNLHEKIREENGLYQANRILERIRSIYNKAIEWGWNGGNPSLGIKKFKEQSRDRFIYPEEMPKFFESLKVEENETVRDYVWLSLFTGARKSNVLSMRWSDINWHAEEWRIPITKNGESHTIPLVSKALEILENRKLNANSEWVFPSATSKSGHLIDPKKGWKRILDRAGIKNLRIHDIRRTLGSYQAITGASLSIIGKSLGHKSSAATEVYSRLNNDPVKASMEMAINKMFNPKKGE